MAFVRLTGRFPSQRPFEIIRNVVAFSAAEIGVSADAIARYAQWQPNVARHQDQLREYLHLRRFETEEVELLTQFLNKEACRLEQTSALRAKAQEFLQEQSILVPAASTLIRLVGEQRDRARQSIFDKVLELTPTDVQQQIDQLLEITDGSASNLQKLKKAAGYPSPQSLLQLINNLDCIRETGALAIDLSWLNNNFQKSLTRRARQYTAYRLRELQPAHRYALIVCFLWQTYRDTIDQTVEMFDKLLTRTERRAENELNELVIKQRKAMRLVLRMFKTMGHVLLSEEISDHEVRHKVFEQLPPELLEDELRQLDDWLTGNKSNAFPLLMKRFSYLRQFAPSFLDHLAFEGEANEVESLLEAIDTLKQMNADRTRKISDEAPLDFVPSKYRSFVEPDGRIHRRAYECAALISLKDEIRRGNVWISQSKRYGRLDEYFISDEEWNTMRTSFFRRANLPSEASMVAPYLKNRLNQAFDQFSKTLPSNAHVKFEANGWHFGSDRAEALDAESENKLADLEGWLGDKLQIIKLPDLLIEVDNELHFTRHFMSSSTRKQRRVEDIRNVIATLMAYGCNIGPKNMARLTPNISYEKINRVADWYLHEDTLRRALADVVNAINGLDAIRIWGEGKTSSSDGQRFLFPQKVLQRTYSPRFGDYALEFYSFIADNYAPFYNVPIECTDRDAAYVLDGLLYHESDLEPEEHYTDTHGYTEINFAAFSMLGRRFCPRIRGLQNQWIYRIDKRKDYGPLTPLVNDNQHTIHLDWIAEHWDRIGQFFASLETGHTTASVALKRLASFTGKNQFYRANRELGRILKTEFILEYNSNPALRRRIQRGLLKGEQLHELARAVFYGKQGKVSARDLQQQISTASCLILILASIIYWQAKEIGRVVNKDDPLLDGIDPYLLKHISPVGWNNIVLYGEYFIDPKLIH